MHIELTYVHRIETVSIIIHLKLKMLLYALKILFQNFCYDRIDFFFGFSSKFILFFIIHKTFLVRNHMNKL